MIWHLPRRWRWLAPFSMRVLPLLAVALTLLLVAGRHERLADQEQEALAELQAGGLVVLLADACEADNRVGYEHVEVSSACAGSERALPFLDDVSTDRGQTAERTRALRALVSSWRGPGNLLVATHGANIAALTERLPAAGEAVLLRPTATGGDVVGRIAAPEGRQ